MLRASGKGRGQRRSSTDVAEDRLTPFYSFTTPLEILYCQTVTFREIFPDKGSGELTLQVYSYDNSVSFPDFPALRLLKVN